jgi:hypothetical protein
MGSREEGHRQMTGQTRNINSFWTQYLVAASAFAKTGQSLETLQSAVLDSVSVADLIERFDMRSLSVHALTFIGVAWLLKNPELTKHPLNGIPLIPRESVGRHRFRVRSSGLRGRTFSFVLDGNCRTFRTHREMHQTLEDEGLNIAPWTCREALTKYRAKNAALIRRVYTTAISGEKKKRAAFIELIKPIEPFTIRQVCIAYHCEGRVLSIGDAPPSEDVLGNARPAVAAGATASPEFGDDDGITWGDWERMLRG